MRSTEIELEKLNKLWATLQTTTMAIDSLTKRAIHDAARRQRRLDEIQGKDVTIIIDSISLQETVTTQSKRIDFLRAELDKKKKRIAALELEARQLVLDDTQQISKLKANLEESRKKYDALESSHDRIHTSYTRLLDLYNNLQAEIKKLREVPAPEPVSSSQLLDDIIKLVIQYSTAKTVTKENVYVIIAALLSKGHTASTILARLKSIL